MATAGSPVSVLSVGQNGQMTIPADFRKAHALSRGGKIVTVRLGEALVVAPHDPVLESICLRLEEAMKGAGLSVEDLKARALEARARIARRRYPGLFTAKRRKRRR